MLLLDEPFGALDAKVRKELRRWLRRLHDELHVTSIFVTHDQEEALEVADRVVRDEPAAASSRSARPQDVYDHPATPFVYELPRRGEPAQGQCRCERLRCTGSGQADRGGWRTSPGRRSLMCGRTTSRCIRPTRAHRDGIVVDVRRVVTLGGSVRIELEGSEGNVLEAELDRETWRELNLNIGDGVTAVPRVLRVFPAQ